MSEARIAAVAKGTGLLGAGMIYQQGISFLSGLIIARMLGAADYGIFNIVRDIACVVVIFTKAGLDIGLNRRLGERLSTESPSRAGKVIASAAFVVLLLGLAWGLICLFGLSDILERKVYRYKEFSGLMSLMMWIVPLWSVMQVITAGFRARLHPAPGVVGEMFIQPSVRLGLSVLLILFGWGIAGVVWANLLGALTALIFILWHARGYFDLTATAIRKLPWNELWEIRNYSMVLATSVALVTLTNSVDVLILGKYAAPAEVGRYAVVKMASVVLTLFGAAFGQLLGPQIAHLWAKGARQSVAALLQQNTRFILMATAPFFMVMAFFGPGLMLIFGHHYVIEPSIIVLVSCSQLTVALFSNGGWMLSMTGDHIAETVTVGLGFVTAVLLNFWLTPRYGALGAACSTLLSILISNAARIWTIYRRTKFLTFRYELLPLFLYAFIPALLIKVAMNFGAYGPTMLHSICAASGYFLVYAGIAFHLCLRENERNWLRSRCGQVFRERLKNS